VGVSEDPNVRERLVRGLDLLGSVASPDQVDRLLALAELLHAWGKRINLTGHRTVSDIVSRLVLEAVGILSVAPPFESLADLGSGAGFPGLPIAILRPEVPVTLVESRQRRNHFQKAAIREIGLGNVRPLLGRAEELVPIEHHAAVAQAMARPQQAVSWMLPWVRIGGWVLLPGSKTSIRIETDTQLRFETETRYRLPDLDRVRTLQIGRRVA
jgi:16S rRNA (guanine527-N7)-methyltransferase